MRFYFDYVSPYAYLAHRMLRSRRVAHSLHPVVFRALLDQGQTKGPAEIPAKRAFLIEDVRRIAGRIGVPLAWPKVHPFRPIEALRLSLSEVSGERAHDVVACLFDACWGHGRDLADRQELTAILNDGGFPGETWLARTQDDEVKSALRSETERAIECGVFGVPTFIVNEQVFWGTDRLEEALAARIDPPERGRVEEIFASAPFIQHLGVELIDVLSGTVDTALVVRAEHLQQDGFVHAGVVATLADHTAGAAAGSVMDVDRTPLTVSYEISLMRPARGPRLRCRAVIVKRGKTLSVADSEVFDGERLVAKAKVTLAIVART